MNTEVVSRKTKLLLFAIVIFVSLCLVEGIRSTVHNLRGKFFPEGMPFLVGYYPNHFLPWGILLCMAAGLFSVSFAFSKYDSKRVTWIVIFMLALVTGFMTLLANKLTYIQGLIWHNEASQLILVWMVAYWTGIIWAYSYYSLRKQS